MEPQSIWQLIFTAGQAATFFWIFFVGAVFAFVSFLLGEIFDGVGDVLHGAADFLHLDSIFHIDADGGGGPSVFSPRVVSVFVTIFGGAGFIASINKIGPTGSSLIGAGSGLAIAACFYLVFSWIYCQQSSSIINNHQLVGAQGIVKTEIPADGIGEVIVDYVGSRITRSAKSKDGSLISTNASVVVAEVRGQTLVVSSNE